MDDLRGTPMSVGTLEEIIDDNHAIVSTSVGSEHYVSILSFVDKDLLEPGCSVLLNHKVIYYHNTDMNELKVRQSHQLVFMILQHCIQPPFFEKTHLLSCLGSCCNRGADG